MKKLFLLFLFLVSRAQAHSLAFVHLGPQLPTYVVDAITQARFFNVTCPIYLIADKEALEGARPWTTKLRVQAISTDRITKTQEHEYFCEKSKRAGLWRYSCERFLYLNDFIQQHNLKNVVHLENDVMLYVDVAELMPVFKNYYKGIAAVFDNDERCIPSFVYIADKNSSKELAAFFGRHATDNKFDMYILGEFKNNHKKEIIDNLPIISHAYAQTVGLRTPRKDTTEFPARYVSHIEQFNSLFDAAALGQYLGGIDGSWHPNGGTPGFVNESCLFDPSKCDFEWEVDAQGRRVPYLIFAQERYRINNLHIHSKNLKAFKSK